MHAKSGSTTTQSTASGFIANATSRLVVNHSNEYGAYIGYANATTDAIAIQSATNAAAIRPLLLDPYGGNVGIGTTSPNHILTLNTTSGACFIETAGAGYTAGTDSVYYGQDTAGEGYFWNRGSNHLLFGTNNAERMRIDSSGRLLLGVSSTSPIVSAVIQGNSSGASSYGALKLARGTSSPADGDALGSIMLVTVVTTLQRQLLFDAMLDGHQFKSANKSYF